MDDDGRLGPTDVERLESVFVREVATSESHDATPSTKFNYAWALSRSAHKADWERSLPLFDELLQTNPDYRRECLFYLAETHFKLGNYSVARGHNDALLAMEPHNQQARQLRADMERRVTQEGAMGLGIVAGGAAVAAVALGLALLLGGGRGRH